MQITVIAPDGRVVMVDVDASEGPATLRAILEAELGVPAAAQALSHEGRPLTEASLAAQGVKENDLLAVAVAGGSRGVGGPVPGAAPAPASSAARAARASGASGPSGGRVPRTGNPVALNADGTAVDPQALMSSLTPQQLEMLPPDLADAAARRDVDALQKALRAMARKRVEAEEEERRFRRLAAEDPMHPEVQRRLEEAIRLKNVTENFEAALEHNPESFGSVTMLYVSMKVNGMDVKAFVDSGAQTTIMSRRVAEACGILRLLDERFKGVAIGVGSAQILGRVHMAPAEAGGHHFPISVTVLDDPRVGFLLGLDNLRRFKAVLDLGAANALVFPDLGLSLPFLAEHEAPKELGAALAAETARAAEGAATPTTQAPAATSARGAEAAAQTPIQDPSEALPRSAAAEAASAAAQARAAASGAPAPFALHSSAPAARAPPASFAYGGPAAVPAASNSHAVAQPPRPADWQQRVQRLQGLGFSPEQCVAALAATGWNEELAGALLFDL